MKAACRTLLLAGLLWFGLANPQTSTGTVAPTEQQLKAVFVFKLSHFVAWPAESFSAPDEPFVIGVLGSAEFAAHLQEAIRDESLDTHPMVVRRFRTVEEIEDCRILYMEHTQEDVLAQIHPAPGTLTVSDRNDAARHGVIIQLSNEGNRIRLVINPDAARNAGLTISSNLLRLATQPGPGGD
jgi:hypothetical protein